MRRTKTVTIGEVLKEFFSRPYVAQKVAEGRLPDFWRMAVGDQVANITTELKLERHILFVRVSSSVIRQELFYRRGELTRRLNELAGIELLNNIVVK